MAQNIKVNFEKLYLVALDRGVRARCYVTKRSEGQKAKAIQFTVTGTDAKGNPKGTLVLDEEKWQEWFGEDDLIEHMQTAEAAARWLVANRPGIHFGCPLCDALFKDLDEARVHAEEHMAQLIAYYDVKVGRNASK